MRLQRLFIRKLQLLLALLVITFSLAFGQHDAYFTPPADPLLGIADSLSGIGDFQGAFEQLKQYERNLPTGVDVKTQTFVKLKLAEALLFRKQKDQVTELINDAENLLKYIEDPFLESEFYFVQAKYYNQIWKPYKAIELGLKAIAIKESLFPSDFWGLGKCYQALVITYKYRVYDDQNTENYLFKTKDIISQFPPYPQFAKAICFYNLSSYLRDKGKILPALSYSNDAIQVVESLGDRHIGLLSDCYSLKANAHLYLEELDKAVYYHKKALSLAEPINWNLFYRYTGLGFALYNKGDYPKAIYYYTRSLKSISQSDTFKLAYNFSKIGDIYLNTDKQDSSFYFLDQSLKLFKHWSYSGKEDIANAHNLLGLHYAKTANDSMALHHFHQSIVASISEFNNSDTYSLPDAHQARYINSIEYLLSTKAKFLSQTGQKANDLSILKNALSNYYLIDTIYMQKSDFLEIESELHDLSHIHQIYGDAIHLLFQLHKIEKSDYYLQLAFEFMERIKARILLKNLISLKKNDLLALPDSLFEKEQLLNRKLEEILLEYNYESEKLKRDSINKNLSETLKERDKLKTKIELSSPEYFQKRYQYKQISRKAIQEQLSDRNSSLLQYFWTEHYIYGIVITKDTIVLKLIKNTNKLQTYLKQYVQILRKGIITEQSLQNYITVTTNLYQYLIAPFFNKNLPEHLIIVPDGPLSNIPFEALLTKTRFDKNISFLNLPYLIQETSVSYAFSSTSLFNKADEIIALKSPKILAFSYSDENTLVSSNPKSRLPELPGAIHEINSIRSFFASKSREYKGHTASKDNFLNNFENYDILHLALHAESDQGVRQNSRIYFRPTNDPDSTSYIMYPHELYNATSQARLVFLSACETALGKSYKGEGIYSIARGFSYIGVPSIVMSLWRLSDQSGKTLIPTFYEGVKAGKAIDKALQIAKLHYLENADEISAHPANWAAFVSLGNQSPVISTNSHSYLFWSIPIMLILFSFLGFKYQKNTHL